MLALATYERLPQLDPSDRAAVDALAAVGIAARPAVWSDTSVDWSRFDAVIVRSCWDYHDHAAAFAAWISTIEQLGVPLWNPPGLLRWNMDKRYLRELAAHDVRIAPTKWVDRGDSTTLATVVEGTDWSDVVVKPVISASGARTWRTARDGIAAREGDFARLVAERDVMVQRFMPEIGADGEWSLVFLGGAFSHSVRKLARPGEFRVQHEHGGASIAAYAPPLLVAEAEAVLSHVPAPWLYARVDGCVSGGQFVLMELEMLEPSLFLDLNAQAPSRFAAAVTAATS